MATRRGLKPETATIQIQRVCARRDCSITDLFYRLRERFSKHSIDASARWLVAHKILGFHQKGRTRLYYTMDLGLGTRQTMFERRKRANERR